MRRTCPVDPQLEGWATVGMLERASDYADFVAQQADFDDLVDNLLSLELGGLLLDGWDKRFAGDRERFEPSNAQ